MPGFFDGWIRMTTGRFRRWLPWLAVLVVVLGFVNFFAFFLESSALGGDGLNGYEAGGHYYVSSHGTYTEVPQAIWTISRVHAVATFVSWPFVLLSMAFLGTRHLFPLLMTGSASGPSDARVAAIRDSGPSVWSGSPGGRVGEMNATRLMLDVAVHPGGIVVKPRFMPPFAILVDEIRLVRPGRSLLTKTIEIDHAGVDVASPVVIYGSPNSPQAAAISALLGSQRSGEDSPTPPSTNLPASPVDQPETRHSTGSARAPGPVRALSIFGLVVGVVLVIAGPLIVVPTFGVFGVVWTGVALVILVVNVRRFLRRGW